MKTNLQLVFTQGASNVLMTDSRRLAEGFGAQHKNVLQKIESILSETEEKFRGLNFQLTSYEVPGPNNAIRSEKMYRMTRDGFMHVALTFKGRKGNDFRIKVLNIFNQMETELRLRHSTLPDRITGDMILQLGAHVKKLESDRDNLRLVQSETPITVVADNALTSTDIVNEWPEYAAHARNRVMDSSYAQEQANRPDNSIMSVYLTRFKKLRTVKMKSKSGAFIYRFNRADVLEVMTKDGFQ